MTRPAATPVPVMYPDADVPVISYSRQVGAPGRLHVHTDEDWEICYIASGGAKYRLGTGDLKLDAGDVLVIGPLDPHACLGWRGERFVTIFRRSMLRETGLAVRCGPRVRLEVAGVRIPARTSVAPWRRTALEYLLDRIQKESFGHQPDKRSMCAALLAQLLLELARGERERSAGPAVPQDRAAHRVVESMSELVHAGLTDRWTLAEMVRRSGYSGTQLGVLFRRATGMSPCQWLSHERVHCACRLLAHSDRTVLQIGDEVGFGTRSQFHRVFRKVTGTTPERYRAALGHEGHPS